MHSLYGTHRIHQIELGVYRNERYPSGNHIFCNILVGDTDKIDKKRESVSKH